MALKWLFSNIINSIAIFSRQQSSYGIKVAILKHYQFHCYLQQIAKQLQHKSELFSSKINGITIYSRQQSSSGSIFLVQWIEIGLSTFVQFMQFHCYLQQTVKQFWFISWHFLFNGQVYRFIDLYAVCAMPLISSVDSKWLWCGVGLSIFVQ